MVVKKVRISLVLMLFLLIVLPVVLAISLGFGSSPEVISLVLDITTSDTFHCGFTPHGEGSLSANVSWFVNGSIPFSSEIVAISNNTPASSSDINISDTHKGQTWFCSVQISNGSTNYTENSSAITIINTLPTITSISDQVAYEDSAFVLQMTYSDADNDSVGWVSIDLTASSYGDSDLFDISSSGLISFNHTDEFFFGNHTMRIIAYDDDPGHSANVIINYEFLAVNDLPIFSQPSLLKNCLEGSLCSGYISATDEENDLLNFTTNVSFINLLSNGSYSFIPTYAQAVINIYTIQINLSDGTDLIIDYFNLTIDTTNHAPNVSYQNVSGIQNDAVFYFLLNATDLYDPDDFFNFSLSTSCGSNPWSFTEVSNGSNSTSALFEINQSLNSNVFVECRDVQVTVHEYKMDPVEFKTDYVFDLFFNITNINDVPIIYNLSYYSGNIQNDIHDLSGSTELNFIYRVNATDIDMLTYMGDVLNYSLQAVPTFPGGGSPLFIINQTTGTITSVQSLMNDSYLGNHSFTVFVTDNGTPQYNYSESINISIVFNFVPFLFPIVASDCAEESLCINYFAGNDTEGSQLTLLLDNLFYTDPLNVTYSNYTSSQIESLLGINLLSPSFDGSTTNFTMSMFSNDTEIGLYVLNYTLRDLVGKTNSSMISFNITNINEPPRLDDNSNHSTFENITFGIFAETVPFLKIIYGYDEDLVYSQDTLNYSFAFIGDVLANFNVTRINDSTALINFTPPPPYQVGNFTVNITISDLANLSESQIINFTVYDHTEFPNITHVRPFYNTTLNQTILSMTPVVPTENETSVGILEDTSLTFDIIAKDTDNQSMLVSWYVNDVLDHVVNYSDGAQWVYSFGFFDSGLTNISLEIWDIGYDHFTWHVNITNTNRAPLFLNNMLNYTGIRSITGRQTIYNFFLQSSNEIIFLDPDDDLDSNGFISGSEVNTLNFFINTSGSCDELASFSFSNNNLIVTPSSSGYCVTNFIASDDHGLNRSSNIIGMNIIHVEGDSDSPSSSSSSTNTIIQTVTVPLETEVEVPEKFVLIRPGIVSIYENGSVVVPIELKNTLDVTLTGITLGGNTSADNVSLKFSKTYIPSILSSGSVLLNLTAYEYRTDAPFEINVSAYIKSLDYTDFSIIYVNALERGNEDINSINSKISFARDLLTDNPECSELFGLLLQAEQQAVNETFSSLKLVNGVISGCKHLINEGGPLSDALPKSFIGRVGLYTQEYVDFEVLGLLLGSLLVIALAFGIVIRFKLKKI